MCTRFVYNGIDKIVGFNFDIDLSVWDHTVITEENRFYIGIKMPDGMYHSFHGINKNGNVGTLLYVHGNENARYIKVAFDAPQKVYMDELFINPTIK